MRNIEFRIGSTANGSERDPHSAFTIDLSATVAVGVLGGSDVLGHLAAISRTARPAERGLTQRSKEAKKQRHQESRGPHSLLNFGARKGTAEDMCILICPARYGT